MSEGAKIAAEVALLLERAEDLARKDRSREVRPEHILLSLVEAKPPSLKAVLEKHKVHAEPLQQALDRRRGAEDGADGAGLLAGADGAGPLAPAPETAALLYQTKKAAQARRAPEATPRDLLTALLHDKASPATELLARRFGLTLEALAAEAPPSPAAAPAADAEQAGVPPLPPGGTGLAAEVRALDLEVRILESRVLALRALSRRQTRRLALVFVLMLMGWVAVVLYLLGLFPK